MELYETIYRGLRKNPLRLPLIKSPAGCFTDKKFHKNAVIKGGCAKQSYLYNRNDHVGHSRDAMKTGLYADEKPVLAVLPAGWRQDG